MVKNFIVKIVLFLIPILCGLGYIEYRLYKIPNTYNLKKEYFEKQLGSIEVLVLGHSHAAFDVNPDFFSHKGFNLGNISQSIYYDKALTLKYLDKMPKLKIVIITTSYFSWYYTMTKTDTEFWRTFFYYRFWGIRPLQSSSVFDMRSYSMIALYSINESQKLVFNGFQQDTACRLHTNGYMEYHMATFKTAKDSNKFITISDSLGKRRVEFHTNIINSPGKEKRLHEVLNDVTSLIIELRKRNIKVVFVDFPVYKTYSKYCDKAIIAKNNRIIGSLCNKYDCKFYNYSNDSLFRYLDFKDNDHLNFRGAEKFSKMIDSTIIKPLLH